jgi:predicted Zn-dependent protease
MASKRMVWGAVVIGLVATAFLGWLGTAWVAQRTVGDRAEDARRDARAAGGTATANAETVEALLAASQSAVRGGMPERALAILEGAVAEHGGDADLRLALAELLVRTGEHGAALSQFEAVLASGERPADVWYAAGTVARLAGRPGRAVELLSEASSRDPGSAVYALHLGQARLALGQIEAAKADLLRAGALDEGLAIVWGTLAEIALRENSGELARDLAARARGLEPGVGAWRVIEARALNRTGDPRSALAVLAALGTGEARSDGVLRTKGESHGLLGRPGDAAEMYAEAWRAEPGRTHLAYESAVWFERAGDGEAALEMARSAAAGGEARASGLVERLEGTP